MKPTTLVIDVSQVQARIDWERARAEGGVRGAYVKSSEATGYVDPRCLEHLEGARRVGMFVGIYHFCHPTLDAAAQVQRAWDACGPTMPHFRLAMDLEAAAKQLSPAQLVAFARAFREETLARFGRSNLFYSYSSFIAGRMGAVLAAAVDLAECPLWLANYGPGGPWEPTDAQWPKCPRPWDRITMWQYSGNGGKRVPGVEGDVDRNYFAGDEAALREFAGLMPEGYEIDMGGPVHGTHVVDAALAEREDPEGVG